MKNLLTYLFLSISFVIYAQDSTIKGTLLDESKSPIVFSNIALYNQTDSTLFKVETSDESGNFKFISIPKGDYFLKSSYIGYDDFYQNDIQISESKTIELGELVMAQSSVQLDEAIVTARRALVEVKADRTVFNVQGTVNSTGDNGLDLLRKAPGVLLDNNNNITVLGRTGVLMYVDGKRLPLSGDDLANYLQNLTSDQIDRIDIITNPSAKYEAEGNAGIIDIRLKKNENFGGNGSIGFNTTKATFWRNSFNASGNYRNKRFNTYAQLNLNKNKIFQQYFFDDFQNDIRINTVTDETDNRESGDLRFGTDFFLNDHHTVGVLVNGGLRSQFGGIVSDNQISSISNATQIDSILIAGNDTDKMFDNQSYNLNYAYDKDDHRINFDFDYGIFNMEADHIQPNSYYTADESQLLSQFTNAYNTPTKINIVSSKLDYETNLAGGRFGIGGKWTKVNTDNTFLFYDIPNGDRVLNNRRSNEFVYDEQVFAGYLNYARQIGKKLNVNTGLRLEKTDAKGDLIAYLPELQEPPVEQDYLSLFPSIGLSYQLSPLHVLSTNYGRRINRPDYNVLNPFENQNNEISFSKGNPFLRAEIVNNIEIGYLYNYRYNITIAYSKTLDQITRLIGPDDSDPRARFINWDNLAEQSVYSLNISLPIQINSIWNAYFNLSGSHLDNQADYGDGVVVNLQAWSYNIFQQHTFTLPRKFIGEISSWFSGPGIWGGVFKYDTSYSINLGLQRKFIQDKLNVKLSVQDIFNQSFWSGASTFNGLTSNGRGYWDARRVSLSMNYNFGNSKVKSRKRDTGIEKESSRVSS